MKIKRLNLYNFRQFYGESEIRFATDSRRNITVIHGENGAGKTALLNAFKWVLYAETTSGVQLKEQIITKRAIYESEPGDNVEAYVELEFEHHKRSYLIRRRVEAKTGNTPQNTQVFEPEVTLQVSNDDGEWRLQQGATEVIGRVLPPDLHGYFFFDGERIEQIVKIAPEEQEQIATASKKLLGVEILDRADKHLVSTRRKLERELRDVGDSQTKVLIDEKEALEKQIGAEQNEVTEIQENIKILVGQRTHIEDNLRRLEGVRALQERRDQLEEDKEKRLSALKEHSASIKRIISSSAHNVFLTTPMHRFEDLCEDFAGSWRTAGRH